MPIGTVQSYLKSILDGQPLPLGLGNLTAVITPPNPNDDAGDTAWAYVWGSHGDEARLTVPRAEPGDLSTGGDKKLQHRPDIWLVWFGQSDEPNIDNAFPAILDAVMAVLRNTALLDQTQYAVDPVTGQVSNLLNVGESMTWEYGPVRAVGDQRLLRFDALINLSVTEIIQA